MAYNRSYTHFENMIEIEEYVPKQTISTRLLLAQVVTIAPLFATVSDLLKHRLYTLMTVLMIQSRLTTPSFHAVRDRARHLSMSILGQASD